MSENGLHKIPAMRTALEAIQEQHPIEETGVEYHGVKEVWCPTCRDHAPCPTRRLADQGLGDKLARTTKNGENK
ncbi:hypothetical protein [Glutamicibacter mishrai]|uniref:hypothetical protein n=1 Tax=Glutamicibacter mishrai TaxID=1775880 RepID=UPI003F78E7FD